MMRFGELLAFLSTGREHLALLFTDRVLAVLAMERDLAGFS
jgi:hypothetical protein